MRLVLLALVVACSTGPTCPKSHGLYCSADEAGLICPEENGATCRCGGSAWLCTDCPAGELPTGTCSAAGQTCGVWGFEDDCACTCGTNGAWSCVVGDPDPNFHCSF
jgi:hypothetical protein